MANTLRIVLILVGVIMIGFGLFFWLFPNSDSFGLFQVESNNENSQIIAMISFGILALIGGIAYKRR